MRYFFPLDAVRFHSAVRPALAACARHRSFAPAHDLCRELAPAARDFVQHGIQETTPPLIVRVADDGPPFRHDLWRLLVGEVLLFGALELPELETPLPTYAALLHQDVTDLRSGFLPIQQAIHGSRDLSFGGVFYRPDHAGWNDEADVRRLAEWLAGVDTAEWRAEDLTGIDDGEREDELAFAREWFPVLRELYRRAAAGGWVLVCEEV